MNIGTSDITKRGDFGFADFRIANTFGGEDFHFAKINNGAGGDIADTTVRWNIPTTVTTDIR